MLTLWQMTQRGIPKPSSHSPGPRGITTPPSLPVPPPASYTPPLLRCCQSFMCSAMISLISSSRQEMICFKNRIQSLNCRTHSQGSAQSSKRTARVWGTVREVSSGFIKGEKAGEGSERKYIDRRARMSVFL